MRVLAPSVAQFGTTKHACSFDRVGEWRRSRPKSSVCENPMQDAYSAVSADTNVQGGRQLPATVVPYMQCMPCIARIACMACATRMPRNACVTCSDRRAFLPRKIASTCENQISGSDAQQHCGAHDMSTRPQACERVGIRNDVVRSPSRMLSRHQRPVFDMTMRPDGHYSLVWAGSVLRKWGSSVMHRPKYRPPVS